MHGILTQHTVGRDGTNTTAAISPVRLNGQFTLLARAHVQQSLVPALDNLSLSDGEAQWLATVVGGIEFGAVRFEGTAVVDVDLIASNGLAFAFCRNGDFGLEVLYGIELAEGERSLRQFSVRYIIACKH